VDLLGVVEPCVGLDGEADDGKGGVGVCRARAGRGDGVRSANTEFQLFCCAAAVETADATGWVV
jgi:hypothetical protein